MWIEEWSWNLNGQNHFYIKIIKWILWTPFPRPQLRVWTLCSWPSGKLFNFWGKSMSFFLWAILTNNCHVTLRKHITKKNKCQQCVIRSHRQANRWFWCYQMNWCCFIWMLAVCCFFWRRQVRLVHAVTAFDSSCLQLAEASKWLHHTYIHFITRNPRISNRTTSKMQQKLQTIISNQPGNQLLANHQPLIAADPSFYPRSAWWLRPPRHLGDGASLWAPRGPWSNGPNVLANMGWWVPTWII